MLQKGAGKTMKPAEKAGLVAFCILILILALVGANISEGKQEELSRLRSYVPFEERISSDLTASEVLRSCISNCNAESFLDVTVNGRKAVKFIPNPAKPGACTRIKPFSGGIRADSPSMIPSTMGEGPICLYQEQYLGRE